jgi:HK97 family phage major capsid protein
MFLFLMIGCVGLMMAAAVTSTAGTPAKPKGKRADILAAINGLREKQAANVKKLEQINKSPDYGGGDRNPGTLFGRGAPNIVKNGVGEKPYSLCKAAAYAKGQISAVDAKEEHQIGQKLTQVYQNAGFMPYAGAHSFLVPYALEFLPKDSTVAEKLVEEIQQKMALRVDRDQLQYAAKAAGYNQKAIGTLLDTAGGAFVQGPQVIEILDMQRNFEAFTKAGASETGLLPNGRGFISKLSTGATAYWVGEAQATTNSDPGTGQTLLEAKKLAVRIAFNNEYLRFGMPGTEALFRHDMARVAGLKADLAMFYGTGGTQIKGLLTYPSATSWVAGVDKWIAYTASTLGTDGDTFESQDVDLMVNSLPDEVTVDQVSFVMRRKLYAGLNSRRASAITAGDKAGTFVNQRVVGISGKMEQTVNGYPLHFSANVPNNRTKGSGTALTLALVGRFSDWVIARMGIMEWLMNSYSDTFFTNDQTGIRGIQHIDAAPRYLASFAACDQLIEG